MRAKLSGGPFDGKELEIDDRHHAKGFYLPTALTIPPVEPAKGPVQLYVFTRTAGDLSYYALEPASPPPPKPA